MLAHSGDGNHIDIEPDMAHLLMEWLVLVARPPGKLFTPSEVTEGKEEEEEEEEKEGEKEGEVKKLDGIPISASCSRKLNLNLLNHM